MTPTTEQLQLNLQVNTLATAMLKVVKETFHRTLDNHSMLTVDELKARARECLVQFQEDEHR